MKIFVGTYISESNDALYEIIIDEKNYNIISKKLLHSGKNPSFIVLNKNRDKIYCVNELNLSSDGEYGFVSTLIKEGDTFKFINSYSTEGNHPCHLCLSKDERFLFITNYTSGSICVYDIDRDGFLHSLAEKINFRGQSINKERQESPHPHQVIVSPCGKFLMMSDLGCDCLRIFSINPNSQDRILDLIFEIQTPKSHGPRHMCLDPAKNILYVVGELSSSVLVFKYNLPNMELIQELRLFPNELEPYPRTSCSEILYHLGYVFVGNRGDDSISICRQLIDGSLELIHNVPTHGQCPRNFTIVDNTQTPSPLVIIANQNSDNLAFFSFEDENLQLLNLIEDIKIPACVRYGFEYK